jgi:hypothetical protein
MTAHQAIEQLKKFDPDAEIMVPSMGHGGSVPLQTFEPTADPKWVNTIYCENSECKQYDVEDVKLAIQILL